MGLLHALAVGAVLKAGWKTLLAIGEYDDLKSVREYEEEAEREKEEEEHKAERARLLKIYNKHKK